MGIDRFIIYFSNWRFAQLTVTNKFGIDYCTARLVGGAVHVVRRDVVLHGLLWRHGGRVSVGTAVAHLVVGVAAAVAEWQEGHYGSGAMMSDGEEKSRREEGDKERGRTAGRGSGGSQTDQYGGSFSVRSYCTCCNCCDAAGRCSRASVCRIRSYPVPRRFVPASGPDGSVPRPRPSRAASWTSCRTLQLQGGCGQGGGINTLMQCANWSLAPREKCGN